MSSLTLLGDTSGSVVLDAPPISGSTTITFAAQSGTLNVGGPAFSAVQSSSQTISNATNTKLEFQTEEFDTANCYSTSTSRFTPNVAGYYQVNVSAGGWASTTYVQLWIWKNGSQNKAVSILSGTPQASGSALIYLNGTTDYIEGYIYMQSGQATGGSSAQTYFQAYLARTA
jgi:hypothetical protein